jgi:hypothetical protein
MNIYCVGSFLNNRAVRLYSNRDKAFNFAKQLNEETNTTEYVVWISWLFD